MSNMDPNPTATGDAGLRMIRRALVTVSDKSGVVDFCQQLVSLGIEILSTGGTAKPCAMQGFQFAP